MTPIYAIARDIDLDMRSDVCRSHVVESKLDLSLAHWWFLANLLREVQRFPDVTDPLRTAIDAVVEGLDRLGRGEEWPAAEATEAGYKARNAAPGLYSSDGGRQQFASCAGVAAKVAAEAAAAYVAGDADKAEYLMLVCLLWAEDAGVSRFAKADILLKVAKEASE
jgi:hypothetical protein